MTDFDSTTPAVMAGSDGFTALLDNLAPKTRVHELAKRFGIASRALFDTLVEQGANVKSSSSSVDAGSARATLTSLYERGLLNPPAPAVQPQEQVVPTPVEEPTDAPEPEPAAAEVAAHPAAFEFLAPDYSTVAAPVLVTAAPESPETSPYDDLPARSRVHELAKRAGISAKAMIAALAERGIEVKSANSVIAKAVGAEVLASLAAPVAGPVAGEGDAPAEPDAHTGPDQGSRESQDSESQDRESQEEERRRRRRRGRRGRGRVSDRPLDDEDQSSDDSDVIEGGDQPVAATMDGEQADEPAGLVNDVDDVEDTDDTEDTDEAEGAAETGAGRSSNNRRRRRRGGRGADRPAAEAVGSEATETGQPAAEDDANEAENDNDEEADDDQAAGTTSRRRRRRRRGTSDETGRVDDPADTVVHVREARGAGTAAAAVSEVQGVRGSTRLEAKRQRRRESLQTRRRPQILTEAEFLARREAVHRVMAVRQRGDLTQVAVLEDNVLVEHFVSRAGSASMIGNVYLGRVQNVLPSMEAAFVDIGRGRNAVLYAGEVNWEAAGLAGKSRKIETALKSGDTVLVQVSKDPVGHKGARLTTQISLPGRFLVYVPAGGATGISRKLPDTERRRLKSILDRIVPDDAGVIIRTAAEGVAEEELARDVERLQAQWEQITAQVTKLSGSGATKQLYGEPDTLIKVIRDLFNSDISELIIDGDSDDAAGGVWESLSSYVEAVAPELAPRVSKFTGATDVFAAHRIDEQIAKALERKVYLPSGGSLVIDRTEAMTVIDVNTGKYTGSGGNLEETVTKNNLEAAEEVVRQLRLRDIGGIIVVDFIDMVLESNRELVLRRLTECLGRDRTRHQVAEVTSLGLVQMTRKKMGTGLVEAFSEPCEHCHGRGIVLRDVPIDPSIAEAAELVADRSNNRRGRGGRRDVVEADPIVAVVPQVAPPRRDPRGPKPPEFGGHGAPETRRPETAPTPETPVRELAHELIAELNGLATELEERTEPVEVDTQLLEALLPAEPADSDSDSAEADNRENAGGRRRRRGGRGKNRRPAGDGDTNAAIDSDTDGDAELAEPSELESELEAESVDGRPVDAELADTDLFESDIDGADLVDAVSTDIEAEAEQYTDAGNQKVPTETAEPAESVLSDSDEGARTWSEPEPEPKPPASAPSRRRRSASRPAGPPQVPALS